MEEQKAPSGEAAKPAPRSRALWIVIAVVVVVVVVLLAAVFGGLFGPPEDRVLKVGTILSITGGLSPFGPGNRQGVILAAEQINAAGGVLGRPVELFHQNDNTDPDTAVSVANTLVTQRVDTIIGATGSGQCERVISVAKANGVFEISGSCTSVIFANLTLTGGWWARTAPPDLYQSIVAASYAATNLSLQRAAVIGINNPYGVGLANLFRDNFVRFGGTVTLNSPRIVTEVQKGATDYTADLAAVLDVAPAPQIVYIVAYPADGVLMMRNYEQGLPTHAGWANVKLFFSEGLYDSKFWNPLKTDGVDTTKYTGTAPAAFGGITGALYPAWKASYVTRWGSNPTLFDDNNYDAMYLVALAAQAAGSATGAAIKSKIFEVANPPGTQIFPGEWAKALTEIAAGHDIDYQGASGAANIDQYGDSLTGYVVWGLNSTNAPFNKEVFPESLVTNLLPSPPLMSASSDSRAPSWTPVARWEEA